MTDTMPRARLVSIAQRTDHARDDVRRIDIARVALVDRPIEGLEGAPGAARAIIDRPGHIVVDASTPGTQLLILTERFHDGWRVSEGDRSVPAIRVYGNYLGCVVVPGVHRIVFTFAPNSLRDGLRLMWLGLALTAGAIVVLWRLPAQVRGVRLEG